MRGGRERRPDKRIGAEKWRHREKWEVKPSERIQARLVGRLVPEDVVVRAWCPWASPSWRNRRRVSFYSKIRIIRHQSIPDWIFAQRLNEVGIRIIFTEIILDASSWWDNAHFESLVNISGMPLRNWRRRGVDAQNIIYAAFFRFDRNFIAHTQVPLRY